MELEFQQVTVDYPRDGEAPMRALQNVSLHVRTGEAVALIGPSGCGKSTMLRLAAGLGAPTAGTVLLDGALVERPRKGTALILQDYGLLPWKTVQQNAELGLLIHHVAREQRVVRAQAALEQVGLADFASAYPADLSGGMQQRLALARALAMDVRLLLMDEPLSALDALMREELQNTLLDLWKRNGHTQVLVTHSIEEAVFLGQRIVVMAPRPGQVVAVIDNLEMGQVSYRDHELFFERCREVRAALAGSSAGESAGEGFAVAVAGEGEGALSSALVFGVAAGSGVLASSDAQASSGTSASPSAQASSGTTACSCAVASSSTPSNPNAMAGSSEAHPAASPTASAVSAACDKSEETA